MAKGSKMCAVIFMNIKKSSVSLVKRKYSADSFQHQGEMFLQRYITDETNTFFECWLIC